MPWSLLLNKYVIGFVVGAFLVFGIWRLGYAAAVHHYKVVEMQADLALAKAKEQRAAADAKAAAVQIEQLNKKAAEIRTVTETVIHEIQVKVPDLRACDVEPAVLRALDQARRGAVPATP